MSYIYLPTAFAAEQEIGGYLSALLSSEVDRIEPSITDILSHKQPSAVENACNNPVSILCGPPGTGKTTTLRAICDSYQDAGMKGVILTPTGKAAKRADVVVNTGREKKIECMTMHRGLEYSYEGFQINRNNQFEYDYVINEEFSMDDCYIARDFLSSVKPGRTRVVFCGDQHQLPSVGPGNFARDMINCQLFPSTELDHIFRQGANSGIVLNAKRILEGKNPLKTDPRTGENFEDFYFVPRKSEQETLDFILRSVCDTMPARRGFDAIEDTQVLSPGRKSVVGTNSINNTLREKLNPSGESKYGFRIGDKVINRKNNYDHDIVNGDVGIVKSFSSGQVEFDFGEGTGEHGDGIVVLDRDGIDKVFLAYCFTVHSSQGSEFKATVIPIHKCHTMLLYREMLYTAISRARELTVVVGDPKAYQRCVTNNVTSKRVTRLMSILREMCKDAA